MALIKAGLQGVSRRRVPRTTKDCQTTVYQDLVQREFNAASPDRLWVADITYVLAPAGFVYLAVVLDAFSRRMVGWTMAGHLKTELVLTDLEMAIRQQSSTDVIHHSDKGVSTRRSYSDFVADRQEFGHPWDRPVTATTMRSARASLPPSSAS